MNVVCIQHVEFETPAYIETIIKKHNHNLKVVKAYENAQFPDLSTFDFLLIMGGPMGANDDVVYSWMPEEKRFIKQCIEKKKKILGICLGAQLLAVVLGAEVTKNRVKEIGFYQVKLTDEAKRTELFGGFPESILPMHWHGDTFGIPEGGVLLGSSDACRNQGFIVDNTFVGLQFHFEMTAASLETMIANCKSELVMSSTVQTEEVIRKTSTYVQNVNQELMERLFVNLCK